MFHYLLNSLAFLSVLVVTIYTVVVLCFIGVFAYMLVGVLKRLGKWK